MNSWHICHIECWKEQRNSFFRSFFSHLTHIFFFSFLSHARNSLIYSINFCSFASSFFSFYLFQIFRFISFSSSLSTPLSIYTLYIRSLLLIFLYSFLSVNTGLSLFLLHHPRNIYLTYFSFSFFLSLFLSLYISASLSLKLSTYPSYPTGPSLLFISLHIFLVISIFLGLSLYLFPYVYLYIYCLHPQVLSRYIYRSSSSLFSKLLFFISINFTFYSPRSTLLCVHQYFLLSFSSPISVHERI